jgi:hypothetical protein
MNRRNQPPVHPFAPVLLALIAAVVLGVFYWVFGIGKDAFLFSVAALGVFAVPVVIVFGIAGLVMGMIRYLLRRKGMRSLPKEYSFLNPNEKNRHRVFPDAIEDDKHILFHGTAAANLESILRNGFRMPAMDPASVSFARDSSLALKYACAPPSQPPRKGCIIAVRFDDLNSPRIVSESFGIHVHRPDALPPVIGYCIVPDDYVFR